MNVARNEWLDIFLVLIDQYQLKQKFLLVFSLVYCDPQHLQNTKVFLFPIYLEACSKNIFFERPGEVLQYNNQVSTHDNEYQV